MCERDEFTLNWQKDGKREKKLTWELSAFLYINWIVDSAAVALLREQAHVCKWRNEMGFRSSLGPIVKFYSVLTSAMGIAASTPSLFFVGVVESSLIQI